MSSKTVVAFSLLALATSSLACKKNAPTEPAKAPAASAPATTKAQPVEADKPEFPKYEKPLTNEAYKALLPKYLATAFCEVVYACPEVQMPSTVRAVAQFADSKQCLSEIGDVTGTDVETKAEWTEEERMSFDAAQAALCLEQLKKLPGECPRLHLAPTFGLAACRGVYAGRQEKYDPCEDSIECAEGLECGDAEGDSLGSCRPAEGGPTPQEGDSCEHRDCAPGLICNVPAGEETLKCMKFRELKEGEPNPKNPEACAKGLTWKESETTCVKLGALAAAGERCDAETTACKLGLTCTNYVLENERATVGTCGVNQPEGAACFFTAECEHGLVCDGYDVGPGHCRVAE